MLNPQGNYTLSALTSQVVASHDEGCRVDSRQRLPRFIRCRSRAGSTALEGGGSNQ